MADIYIAVNGDDVGTTIGQHIAADDHENLQNTSNAVKEAQQVIGQWVEQQGGQEVTSSGDEGVYVVPEEAIDGLEDIRSQYQDASGHSLTVGIGSSMSEASKALIYGKLNGKNQITQYDQSIDQHLMGDDEDQDESIPLDDKTQEQDNLEEPIDEFTEEPEEQQQAQDKHPDEPEHEEDMGPEEEMAHDAIENEDDEQDSDNVEADEEMAEEGIDGVTEEEDFGTKDDEAEGQDEGDVAPEDSEVEDEESVYEDLTETDGEEIPEEEMAEEGEEDAYDYNDSLTDMIQGHMEGEEGEEIPEEEMAEEGEEAGAEDDDLKSDIATALMAFKQNKAMLEAAQEENPELYDATITMLRSMIDMAKKLGYSPEEDLESMETEDQMVENFPDAEMEEEDMVPPPENPADAADGEEDEEPEKKPKGRDQ